MKPTRSIPYLLSAVLFCSVPPQCVAQARTGLSIQIYAGLTLTGAVGTVYTVQYNTNLAQADGWRGAGVVQLPNSPYLWVDTAAPAAGQRFYRAVEGPTNMVWIPVGTFTMGSPSNEMERSYGEGPQTVVTLTRGLFMGQYEVTQGEYVDVMGSNPSSFRNGVTGADNGGMGDTVTDELRHPVESVTWNDATNYCARLTERERATGRMPAGYVYRLPTEAEWEYACRAGTTSAFHYGPALRSGMANFHGRYEYTSSVGTTDNSVGDFLGRTTVVGSYEANGWRLHDMHGNLWEWCSDWRNWAGGLPLPGGRVIDPQGPPPPASSHVIRGGSWHDSAFDCRSASRGRYWPDVPNSLIGFRVVLASGQ